MENLNIQNSQISLSTIDAYSLGTQFIESQNNSALLIKYLSSVFEVIPQEKVQLIFDTLKSIDIIDLFFAGNGQVIVHDRNFQKSVQIIPPSQKSDKII